MDSNKPLFVNPNYKFRMVEDGVFLVSELEQHSLSGKAYQKVLSLVDGRRNLDEIVSIILREDRYAPLAEVYFVVETMKQKGYLVEGTEMAGDQVLAYWDRFPRKGDEPLRQVDRSVKITDLGSQPAVAPELRKQLKQMGVSVRKKAALEVVIADNYLDRRLLEINRRNLASGQVWMPFKPDGKVVFLGPVFGQSGESGCFQCLHKRLAANREVETFLMELAPDEDLVLPAAGISTLPAQLSVQLAAIEVGRFFAHGGFCRPLEQQMLSYSIPDQQSQHHGLVHRPQCPACGEPERYAEKSGPLTLKSVKKRFTEDGGHRTATPEETLRKYEHHISPVTGIVNHLSRITGDEDMIHSYYAGHNSASRYRDLLSLKNGLRSKAGGKGKSDLQARVSGLCEAIERYSGLYEGYEKRILASYNQLGADAIHPNECMNFSDFQYSIRKEWNQFAGGFQTIPTRLDPDLVTEWSPVWSLTAQRYKYLPTAYLYFSYSRDKHEFYTWADSNGNASGNTLEEAILQGFLELVERDAVALWWYNRISRPGVDLESFGDPWMTDLKARYQSLNREIWALDISSDFGIPVFAGISRRTDKEKEDIIVGFGAHFDAKIALTRALTEVNQFMPAVMNVPAEGKADYRFDDPAMLFWWKNATAANQPYICPASQLPLKRLEDYPREFPEDLLEDVENCRRLVESKGMEMLVMDQTRPDVGMPVVKVIVPGMRHFWARFGPGRLFEVPVQMGWLPQPLHEKELNPIPMFI